MQQKQNKKAKVRSKQMFKTWNKTSEKNFVQKLLTKKLNQN